MKQAAAGDTVRVHYTGAFADGTEFDNSSDSGPMELTIGKGEVFPALETALVGMAEGDKKSITLEPPEAFGAHDPELVHVIERERIPAEVDLKVGAALKAMDQDEKQINMVVVALTNEEVTLDANHPLAGHKLTFELTLSEVVG